MTEFDEPSGRRTRYYFAAVFIQENTRTQAFSSKEVGTLWVRWAREHGFVADVRTELFNKISRRSELLEGVSNNGECRSRGS
jgi:hypothetical protein